jgi:hypothetical protein
MASRASTSSKREVPGRAGGPGVAGRDPPTAAGPPSCRGRSGGSQRPASRAAIARGRPAAAKLTAGLTPAQAQSPPSSDPARPPKLKLAWNEVMSGRPRPRSARTAWAFTATSSSPPARPKQKSPAIRASFDEARPIVTGSSTTQVPPATVGILLPNR